MNEYREAIINAKIFANKFCKLAEDFKPPVKDSNITLNYRVAMCNGNIIDFLVGLKNCSVLGRCDMEAFKDEVIKRNSSKLLDIEVWWYLKLCDIMKDEDFYQIFDSKNCQHITDYISMSLCKSISPKTNSQLKGNMNSDFIELILSHKERCLVVQYESPIYHSFLKCLASHSNTNSQNIMMFNSFFADILKITSVKDSVIKQFLLDLIEVFLQGEPMTLETILQETENFVRNENATAENLIFFDVLDSDDIFSRLKEIFLKSSKPMNFKNLSYLIFSMTSQGEHILKHYKALTLFLLNDALENLNKNSLLYVFILARHCSFPKVPNFPTYLNWFRSTFSSESSRPINTKEKSLFFMNFLNETLKYDLPYYLKVHINRAPCLPIECQYLVSDYVKLVKTVLSDLNESTELGLFNNITTKSSPEFDVETVLNIFSNTNEVPNCVLEASLFCKTYYEKKFLVTLLSKYEGKNSVRHKLITKLQSLSKIPNSLYLNYKQLI